MPPTAAPATMNLHSLFASLPDLTPNDSALIERAYHKAEQAHAGQFRKSGEPYFTHCVAVASILADMKLDAEAIAAALMHDIVEDTDVTIENVEREFGKSISRMVDGVTKLKHIPINVEKDQTGKRPRDTNRELEYIRKMLLTMGDDVRTVLIKLADRLHNMRTLGYMPAHKQKIIAKETMEIFAPLANRLGIWQIKWELEDLSFRYLEPDAYKSIAHSLEERRADREAYMKNIATTLSEDLAKHGITNAVITWRPKHIYSIYRKMQRKGLPFQEIYDVRAIRVICDTVPQCYLTLGIVHNLWRPIMQEFDDYIAAPKDNFYQSLHTAVIDKNGKTVEVQIRTWEMHEHAEYGVAAHWRYKEGNRKHDELFQQRLNYLRRLMEFGPEVSNDPEAFIETMRSEVFQDRVYAYTPHGDIIDLPVGATPIDFAYHVHTEIGNRCRGAKVHGRLVSLNYQLRTGDQVEIITAKRGGPSMDWLNPEFGYVRTTRARSKIKHYFRKLHRDKHISLGREVLERELKRLGVMDRVSFDAVAAYFDYTNAEDFLSAVGAGDINGSQIAHRVLDAERAQQRLKEANTLLKVKPRTITSTGDDIGGVNILGTGGLLVSMAKCCSPMPGDEIVGYVTRGRGVSVHRRDCTNIVSMSDPERLIDVSWGSDNAERRYAVPVEIVAYDREGLLRDISTAIADEKVNIADVTVNTKQDIATLHITMEIANNTQLTRVLSKVTCIKSVVEAYRCKSS
ncbi:MAG: bifunctional (p)ppGpp synthetase/guanosine-3',5'-bis(diphosphate) 3'-pyrophosphohydrolase [bacterium]|nr:bifunctional (p)ppGpp synthetase/guanosine-3',5'-bis(diphosphate) 3'-pyrophosphohydrolase [bacterium]